MLDTRLESKLHLCGTNDIIDAIKWFWVSNRVALMGQVVRQTKPLGYPIQSRPLDLKRSRRVTRRVLLGRILGSSRMDEAV